MSRRFLTSCAVVFMQALALAAQTAPDASGSAGAVARFGDQVITASQLDQEEGLRAKLVPLRQQEYTLKRQFLEELIFDRLVDRAAREAGLSREAFLKAEVTDKAGPPPDDEVDKVMKAYRSRLDADPEKARQQVVSALARQRQHEQRLELKKRLFREANVEILLEPIRLEPALSGHPSRGGGSDAPVTLVEYSDFQCPYCGRVQSVLNEVMKRYGSKVRHVFKQLPLSMHANAQQAAEASLCAADQGRFWELHNWMFANQDKLDRESLVVQAKALGMDAGAFTTCLDRHVHAGDVERDAEEAKSFGIDGTPGFLVQGRLISGSQPLDAFVQIIDEELERGGEKTSAPRPAPAAGSSPAPAPSPAGG
jgi:protein-disulfide isomerase